MWNIFQDDKFDIIIEDGLHEFHANVCFFENSIHKLSKGGFYIIEDVIIDEKYLFESKIKEWKEKFDFLKFNVLVLPSDVNNYDNTLIVVHYPNN